MFSPFSKSGIGIHTGQQCEVTVSPRPIGTGLVIENPKTSFVVDPNAIDESSDRATVLCSGKNRVSTVEHLLAALSWFGISNANIKTSAYELPILDGSSLDWALALQKAGAKKNPKFFELTKPMEITHKDSTAAFLPISQGDTPVYEIEIHFENSFVRTQSHKFFPTQDNFVTELAPARTFAFEEDIAEIRASGLGKGGSLENALILNNDGPLNADGLRFENEPARHKLLDAIGDLFIFGALPLAHMKLYKPGHRLMHRVVASLHATQTTLL